MTIFDIIADILFHKRKTSLSNIDNESSFSPFMLSRWFSMYSNSIAIKCNLLNKFLAFNKQSMYCLFFNILDKVPTRKINYFKKNKETISENETISMISKSLELSKRELNIYNDLLNSLKTHIK